MDLNANLKEQREIAARIIAAADAWDGTPQSQAVGVVSVAVVLADAERLAELVQALDGWLSRGGFQPAAWRVKP